MQAFHPSELKTASPDLLQGLLQQVSVGRAIFDQQDMDGRSCRAVFTCGLRRAV